MIPEALFRYISTFKNNAKNKDCDFHEFVQSSLKATLQIQQKQPCRFTCKNCFISLDWRKVKDSKSACKSCHFAIVKNESQRSNGGTILEIECEYCQICWTVSFYRRLIEGDLLSQFLSKKTESEQATVLFMLEFYTANIYHGNPKPINSENPKFNQFIGINDISLKIIGLIGYKLVGTHFRPNGDIIAEAPDIYLLLKELSLYRFTRSKVITNGGGDTPSPSLFLFTDATFLVCEMIGLQFTSSPKVFLDSFRTMISCTPLCFLHLGCTKNASDSVIISSFESMRKNFPQKTPHLMDSLLDVAQFKQSSILEEFLMVERSKGVVSFKELSHAYKILGGSNVITDETPSRRIIENFKYALTANNSKIAELKDALQLIANYRDCAIIEYWIKNGQLPPYSSAMDVDLLDLPAGLNNIGNTCYVNPVFQFMFALTDMRNFILSYKSPEQINLDLLNDYEKKFADRAISFIKLFQELFYDLLFSNEMAVTPQKKLIQLILNDTNDNMFGLQQDITETIDQIVFMISLLLKLQGINMAEKSLFYGKELQTITYTKEGVEKILQKEIGYRSLIVDVRPNLIDAIEDYYGKQTVEFEGVLATKFGSISCFPSFVSVRINRLSYDRKNQRPVKSNDFVKFPKELRLGRFAVGKEAEREEQQQKLNSLMDQLGKKKNLLLSLTTKKHRVDNPIELLTQSARKVGEDKDLAAQLTAVSQEVKALIEATNIALKEIENEIDHLYMDKSEKVYQLAAVFMHEGEAGFGHYWHYGFDPQFKRWIKYNDSLVSVVDESDVFADTTGSTHNAIVLLFVDVEQLESQIQPFVRQSELRAPWKLATVHHRP